MRSLLWLPSLATLALLAAPVSTLTACNRDAPARKQPHPTKAKFATSLRKPERLSSVPSSQRDTVGRVIRVACVTCHSVQKRRPLPQSMAELDEFHNGMTFGHGELSCAHCHVDGEPTQLHLATGKTVPTEEALQLCSQCHGPKYRDYKLGIHGGMTGYWDLSRGPRLRNHCVDCHDPHMPAVPQVMPVLPPVDAQGPSQNPATEGSHP